MTAGERADHVVLVGMMGVGKTTVGLALAAALKRPFADSDAEVEARTGRTVRQIFATDGEAAFRALESQVLADALAEGRPSVVAAAGGVVLDEGNRELLRRQALVVWLRAPLPVLVDRAVRGDHRPALQDDPEGVMQQMVEDRTALYREVADLELENTRPVEDVVAGILQAVAAREAVA